MGAWTAYLLKKEENPRGESNLHVHLNVSVLTYIPISFSYLKFNNPLKAKSTKTLNGLHGEE